ncbi:MAG: septal ring lytic transglycosylase RlpA family protein [Candidatus Kappaea frigidicola]|nr:septal ring lytic transglycosylase RlpA family protein [Candidatus Kappaea frigidicola]
MNNILEKYQLFIDKNRRFLLAIASFVLIVLAIHIASAIYHQYNGWVIRASFYGRPFHGRRTSCGEVYNMNALTAAHRTLPMGTRLKVTNLKNGRSVIVRINDRGPFMWGRNIDLSVAAAKQLKMVKDGITKVRIEIIK